jgi:PAS domain S-box-containing protein
MPGGKTVAQKEECALTLFKSVDMTQKPAPNISRKSGRFPKYVFLALFLPMVVLLGVIGFSLDSLRTEARIKEMLDNDSTRLHLVSGFLGAEVLGSLKHLRSLATEAVTTQAVDSRNRKALRALESSFLTLAQRNPKYQQIRWIDKTGMEKARVTRAQGEPFVVASRKLQDKSSRYYFQEANALLPGELYISPMDLNVEHGQIEMPPRPVLRIATPVTGNDRKRRGIIVINIDMRYLFDLLRLPVQMDSAAEYFLVNQQGILLTSQGENIRSTDDPEQSVNFILTHPEVWEKIAASDSGSLELPDGLWSWETLSPVDAFNRSTGVSAQHRVAFDQLISNNFSLTMLAHRPAGVLREIRRENHMLISLGTIFILSVYSLSLFFYLSGQTRARRAEVEAAYATAQAANLGRMKELEERFHLLVEASSIGQLVVDGDGRIEIANPAAGRMLGYDRKELEDLQVDALLPALLRQKHAQLRKQFMQAPEARKMGVGRKLEAVRKDGSTIPVEVGLNPYSDHGRPLILASIIEL